MENTEYTFFWNGPFSNFYPVDIIVDGVEYANTEQYFMAQKALHFHDTETYDEIMKTKDPKEAKALGRKVKGFDVNIWQNVSMDYMFKGNYAKYTQNKILQEKLLATGNSQLVEASPFDKIWGIGLDEKHAAKTDESEWPGLNWLGITLCNVRAAILNDNNPKNEVTKFEKLRENFEWGSFGRNHDEPMKRTKLKDISDSHLLHIIPWIERFTSLYSDKTLQMFKDEMKYRMEHYIYIPDYDKVVNESSINNSNSNEGLKRDDNGKS